jgi:alanyl-tRNA synthetase
MVSVNTERLFDQDVRRTKFETQVLERRADKNAIILDRTCFYPESGGQLPDTGTLNGVPVTDVQEEGEAILHFLDGALPEGTVQGRVDWEMRFDHMQQHTGQHLLSGAFDQLARAMTVGFHMSAEYCTIDLRISALVSELADRVEDLANRVVFEDRPVKVLLLTREEALRLPLRKRPPDLEILRVLEIKDFDYSACGGTHCQRTGEVGLVKIASWEKIREDVRVEFLCGGRALRDYRWRNTTLNALAGELSIAPRDLEPAFQRLRQESADKGKRIKELLEESLKYEAERLVREAEASGLFHLVIKVFPDRDLEEVKGLANRLAEHPGTVALLAATADKANLVFARSQDLGADMNLLMKEAVTRIGGKGGGRPNFAQGGGPLSPDLPALLSELGKGIR